jgi:hypothetical protein
MYEAYVAWAEDNAVTPWKERAFGRAMTQKGFRRDRTSTTRRYLNVKLHDVPQKRRNHNESPQPAPADDEVPV